MNKQIKKNKIFFFFFFNVYTVYMHMHVTNKKMMNNKLKHIQSDYIILFQIQLIFNLTQKIETCLLY